MFFGLLNIQPPILQESMRYLLKINLFVLVGNQIGYQYIDLTRQISKLELINYFLKITAVKKQIKPKLIV